MNSIDEFDSRTAALLNERYRMAEDLLELGLFRRLELGWGLFELMNHVGETRLRRMLVKFCPDISSEAAFHAMHLLIVADPEPLPDLIRLEELPLFAWLSNRYRQAEHLDCSALRCRVQLGDRLIDLRIDVGETQLRRLLTECCPKIPWEDAQTSMNFAVVIDRDFLEELCHGR